MHTRGEVHVDRNITMPSSLDWRKKGWVTQVYYKATTTNNIDVCIYWENYIESNFSFGRKNRGKYYVYI